MTLPKPFGSFLAASMMGFIVACATAPPEVHLADGGDAVLHPATLAEIADLEQIAMIAVLNNPELRAFRAREGVATAQVFAAGLLPDPTISIGADFPLDATGAVTGGSSSFGLDLLALMRRPRERVAAEVARDAIRDDIAWAEWLTAEQARLLAVRIDGLRTLEELTDRLRILTHDQLQRALLAAGRGDLPGSGLESYRLAAADAIDRYQAAELRLSAAEFSLNRLLDQPCDQICD